ncbi:MAG: D-aminoacyl-tRNA deacylase, partial [Candidatus Cloacimonas acidaminovorans]|nr:D-aminoacyl-tRNA deacylase [Candidatus Cloacimonas acidaminovorans]
MRITLQRVSKAICYVDNEIVGKIENGLLIFVGFATNDTFEILPLAVRKCLELRIFNDENDKMNKSVLDIQGSVLVISQFTLYANCKRGRRPDFTQS